MTLVSLIRFLPINKLFWLCLWWKRNQLTSNWCHPRSPYTHIHMYSPSSHQIKGWVTSLWGWVGKSEIHWLVGWLVIKASYFWSYHIHTHGSGKIYKLSFGWMPSMVEEYHRHDQYMEDIIDASFTSCLHLPDCDNILAMNGCWHHGNCHKGLPSIVAKIQWKLSICQQWLVLAKMPDLKSWSIHQGCLILAYVCHLQPQFSVWFVFKATQFSSS